MASSPIAKLSIEELIGRLEEITRTIEQPDTGLEKSITLYEEGLSLAESCRKRLQDARHKIELLTPETTQSVPKPPRMADLFDSDNEIE